MTIAVPFEQGRRDGLTDELRDRRSTAEELARFATERGIASLALMHVAGDGELKVLDFVVSSERHLVDVLTGGERADGSSLFPASRRPGPGSDVLLRPRVGTAFMEPFAQRPTLGVLCGHAEADGVPFASSPDSIVRAASELVRGRLGITVRAHGEVEYFLGRPGTEDDDPRADGGYHATAPYVFGEDLRRRALAILAEIGIPVKYAHSEVGHIPATAPGDLVWEQHEIELALAPLPEAADAIALTRWVLRRVARDAGYRCSFDPILRTGHAGTGLHVHFALSRDGVDRVPLTPEGALAPEAGWLVGGLARMAGALMAFGNRSAGSFERLSAGREAPRAVSWGVADRQALIRVPIQPVTSDGRVTATPTVEFRLPDGSAHPHLLLAGVAVALLQGSADPELGGLLDATRSGGTASASVPAPAPLPGGPVAVAEALDAVGELLSGSGVFPAELLRTTSARLRSGA